MAYTRAQRAILSAFGKQLRLAREAHGWTQEELAEKADLNRTYVGGIERGERNVALLNISKLAVALGGPAPTIVPPTVAQLERSRRKRRLSRRR